MGGGSQPSCAAKEIHEASKMSKPFIVLSACWNGEFDNIQNIILGTDKDQSIFEKSQWWNIRYWKTFILFH